MNNQITIELLEELESKALAALVRQAADGNATAAASALAAIERVRKTRHAELHAETMSSLAGDGPRLAGYLCSLGQSQAQVAARLGRSMTKAEVAAWQAALDDRLLEVRAVELGRMRRGDGDVPVWATRSK